MFRSIILSTIVAANFLTPLHAGEPITMDGYFDDWIDVPVAYSDALGDATQEDFMELLVTNDNSFLFLNLSFNNPEFSLRSMNSVTLYIDMDNNVDTGLAIHGIGAEMAWSFGSRAGTFYSAQDTTSLSFNAVALRISPTYAFQQFEVAFSLSSSPMTLNNTQIPDTLLLVLVADGTDFLPDEAGGVEYIIDPTPVDLTTVPLARFQRDHVRLVTYNMELSGIVDANRQVYYERIIKALDPDILALQEVNARRASQVQSLIRVWLQNSSFTAVGLSGGNMVVSKYPVMNSAQLIATGRTSAVLLDTEAELGANLLVLNTHLIPFDAPASEADADEIIMRLREWRAGNGPFELEANTPIVHVGDFNLSGPSQLLKTVRDGDIVDEARFGEDSPPDWDGTEMRDLNSRQTAERVNYTTSRGTAKLDYVFYTDAVIEAGNNYILKTTTMTEEELVANGLEAADTDSASDHLPTVLDIAAILSVSVEANTAGPSEFRLFPAYPNPFNPATTIQFSLPKVANVTLTVYNTLGQKVATLLDNEELHRGDHSIDFDAGGLSSGVYLYRLAAGDFESYRKMTLLK